MRTLWNRLQGWRRRRAISAEVAEEMRAHLQMEVDDYVSRGMSPAAARQAASARFGSPTAIEEAARETWGLPSLESLVKDIRHALRAMRRAPVFSLAVILTFALGVGLNTAIFSVVHAVLLKPLPYPTQERLVWFGESTGKSQGISVSWGNFRHWRESNQTFEEMAAFLITGMTLTGVPEPLILRGLAATSPYFPLLGMRPLLGRLPVEPDDQPGASRVVVLSHRFWSVQFGADPQIVGRSLTLNSMPYQVIGVAAPLWQPWNIDFDYYVPLGNSQTNAAGRAQHGSFRLIGRLREGVTLAAARADLDRIMAHLDESDPGPEKGHRSFGRYLNEVVTGEFGATLWILMGAAALILLIACSNIASLLLARNTGRVGELAVRTAIGAGAWRLMRQLLTETVVLAAVGGLAGIALSWWALRLIAVFGPREIPRLAEVSLDIDVLLFAAALTLLAALIAGIAPVLSAGRINVSAALKESARSGGAGKRRQALRGALVIGEIALTFVLAFASVLLLRSLTAAQSSSPGFNPHGVLSFSLNLPAAAYSSSHAVGDFYQRAVEELRTIPGVAGAALVDCQPAGGSCGDWFFSVPDRGTPARNEVPVAFLNNAGAGYFRTMGVPVRQGREFEPTDLPEAPKVAIVNEAFARTWWPGESPVGRQIKIGGPYQQGPLVQVVGVTADIRQTGLDSIAQPEIFLPYEQRRSRSMTIVIRATGDAAALAPIARSRIAALNPNLPLHKLTTLDRSLSEALTRRRFSTLLLTCFAALAMILAAVGIYGLLSYWVRSREPEIAIRLALGASPNLVLRWSGSHAMRLSLIGIALGACGAWAGAGLFEKLVFAIPTRDTATMVCAAAAVLFISLAAIGLPALRAARLDPARTLRSAAQ